MAQLNTNLVFAFDNKIGYATSLIKNLGGIEVKVKFCPKFFDLYKERITPEIAKDRFNVDLIFENDDDTGGDLLVLKSRTKYGKTESEVLLEIMECMQAFFNLEDEYRHAF